MTPSEFPPPLATPGRLTGWLAALAVDESARRRSAEHWLRRQAEEEGTFAGVLADLAERGRPVVVDTAEGRHHHGVPTLLGRDVVVVRTGSGREVLLRLDAIAAVRTRPDERATVGDRVVHTDLTLHESLAALAEERPRVQVVHRGGVTTAGEVRACGQDVVTLRLEGEGGTAYLAVASVSEVSLAESG